MSKRWYVVQTKSKNEPLAVENLENQKFKCFLPQELRIITVGGKDKRVITPLFPKYLFVKFDIAKDRWRSINGTRGVIKLLTATEEHCNALPKGFVEDLIKKTDKSGCLKPEQAQVTIRNYSPGDAVTIKKGIFEGLSGTYVGKKKDIATVILTLLSAEKEVKLPLRLIN